MASGPPHYVALGAVSNNNAACYNNARRRLLQPRPQSAKPTLYYYNKVPVSTITPLSTNAAYSNPPPPVSRAPPYSSLGHASSTSPQSGLSDSPSSSSGSLSVIVSHTSMVVSELGFSVVGLSGSKLKYSRRG